MAHAEVFKDSQGYFRWLAVWNDRPAECSPGAFKTAQEALTDAQSMPLTVVPYKVVGRMAERE